MTAAERVAVICLAEELESHHRLRGAWSAEKKLIVVRLLDTHLIRDWTTGVIRCFPWGWAGGTYGGSLSLTVSLAETGSKSHCRASVFIGDAMLKVLRSEPFTLAIVNGKQIVRCDRIDYTCSASSRLVIESFVDSLEEEGAKGWVDGDANYWETLFHHTVFHKYLTAEDKLSIGWFARVEEDYFIRAALTDLNERGFGSVCRQLSLDDDTESFIQAVESCNGDFRIVRDHLLSLYDRSPSSILPIFLDQLNKLPDDEKSGFAFGACHAILHSFVNCAAMSLCGKRFPWWNAEGQLMFLELEPRQFPTQVNPREYWTRQLGTLHFGWGHLLDGSDVPVSKSELEEMLSELPTSDNAAECFEQADFLLAEAESNKEGCIPPNALVQISIGPFVSMELREIYSNVLVALRKPDGLVYYFTVEPNKSYWSAEFPHDENNSESELKVEKVLGALKLLVAAVIRDFWVVEHREFVFEQRQIETQPRNRKESKGFRIVYLPRVKYDCKAKPDIKSCASELDTATRRSHVVVGHLRKSLKSSNHQLALAERYGFSVPDGYTFVRPHERGKSKRDVVYRSRSALQSLYTATVTNSTASEVSWFKFERDVQSLMQRLGFTVEHIAVSRQGDKGVDVYATKGEDLDAICWVIQCKCWNSRRKVLPSVVRELVGTLTRYPPGTRGMIVTTSGFSSGAVEEADSHNIRLMNGEEFMQRLIGEK